MRILFLSTFYPPYVIGGWEQLVEDLNHGLSSRGHQTLVLTSTYGLRGRGPLPDEQGVSRSLQLESDLQFYQPAAMLSYRQRTHQNLDATRRAIESFRPDVVFVHIMWNLSRGVAWLAEQLMPGRVVYYVADHWIYSPDPHESYWRDNAGDPLRSALKRMVAPLPLYIVGRDRRRFCLTFPRVLCVSRAIRQALLEHVPSLDPGRIDVVYNGIDVDAFPWHNRVPAMQSDGLRLLFAGSLVPHKGAHVAVAAMGELARRGALGKLSLTIVGAGRPDYEDHLRRDVTRLGLDNCVRFVGRVPRSEMSLWLSLHDVLLFPSEWPEPLARMTQEAMASGAVVIGTNTGGTGEILVHDETGLVFATGHAAEMADWIGRLQREPEMFARLAANARHVVEERFSFTRMLDQVEDALTETVAQRPGASLLLPPHKVVS